MSVTKLSEAVQEGNIDRVREMIEAGADVNEADGEQEWTPLHHAAGKGDLVIVKLLVEQGKAGVFKVGRDRRTPYKIALAACHREVAAYLREAEEKAGGDTDRISSREWETRPYCKAYRLMDLKRFSGWSAGMIDRSEHEEPAGSDGAEGERGVISDDDIVYIHQDFTVTRSVWHGEDVLFDDVTPEWKNFCTDKLSFKVATDFDLIPDDPIFGDRERETEND